MFLAWKEMRYEKLRYTLIIAMIVLISYLIFILTSLAQGLARQNTDAIKSWDIQSVVLNDNANTSMTQSIITKSQLASIKNNKKMAIVTQVPVVVRDDGNRKISAQFVGINNKQFIMKNLKITDGKKPIKANEIVVDSALKQSGYQIGDKIKLNSGKTDYVISGFVNNAKLNISPVIYGSNKVAKLLKNAGVTFAASAVVSQDGKVKFSNNSGLKNYTVEQFIKKLPGYSAQTTTFVFMIGFLMIISLVVVAVFLYILTMQKLENYAVLRAQGVPVGILVRATISQSLLIVISGLIIGTIFTGVTASFIPAAVPMYFSVPLLSTVAAGLVVVALLGVIIPIRIVTRVDPVTVIGG
ncbi:ABC transporter permease [Liquorilactobacillus hordei]|uniref:Putative hemin transport system permease protein HrtB n=1 Tax=Liquorilactobacillus hordei DSM 19519 TaxID=1423759 RepID=A0A0R1MJI4_9LACO|nr:FtsX-like permease family protein [Liquorilactobacillus hordei]KRL08086.1 peptide ABC transporter permease [Liquorilactobacillus hordei DSM 19519]QYH51832.1 FtsX-like permease family protein [Liquorilactobacillus hordei DSM 19519]